MNKTAPWKLRAVSFSGQPGRLNFALRFSSPTKVLLALNLAEGGSLVPCLSDAAILLVSSLNPWDRWEGRR